MNPRVVRKESPKSLLKNSSGRTEPRITRIYTDEADGIFLTSVPIREIRGLIQQSAKGNLRKNYRRALPALLRDFERRCAYSMQHERFAGGELHMEVDHHDPTLRDFDRSKYENLFLSTRHCNNKKRACWPTRSEQKRGIRFLNCCKEQDYGVHIFEDHSTGQLVGVTPAGRYHIRMCDLNAPHFVRERRERTKLVTLLSKTFAVIKSKTHTYELLSQIIPLVKDMIPAIPAPPEGHATAG